MNRIIKVRTRTCVHVPISRNKILKSHCMKTIWVLVDPKVPADPMVDLSTDPVDPNNPADTVVDPTDKPVRLVIGPAVGPVDKPDAGPKYNIDKPSAVGPEHNHEAHY
ncbi:hypothetical protein Tco_0454592 [Tanacetum coccineum]